MKSLLRYALVAIALCLLPASAQAATCYWVGGTANWDNVNTTSWASSTGGTPGTCAAAGSIPKNGGDTATFDGSSGGGTVTVCGALSTTCPSATGSVSITTINFGAFTGKLDFSAINPNVTLSTFNGSGSGTRELDMGSGTWTISSTSAGCWTFTTATGLTLNAGTSVLKLTGTFPAFTALAFGASTTYATVNIGAQTGGFGVGFAGPSTVGTLILNGPISFAFSNAMTITNAVDWEGTSSKQILLNSGSATITLAAGSVVNWAALINFKVGSIALSPTNSFDIGGNNMNGGSITPPSGGSSRGYIIGG